MSQSVTLIVIVMPHAFNFKRLCTKACLTAAPVSTEGDSYEWSTNESVSLYESTNESVSHTDSDCDATCDVYQTLPDCFPSRLMPHAFNFKRLCTKPCLTASPADWRRNKGVNQQMSQSVSMNDQQMSQSVSMILMNDQQMSQSVSMNQQMSQSVTLIVIVMPHAFNFKRLCTKPCLTAAPADWRRNKGVNQQMSQSVTLIVIVMPHAFNFKRLCA